MKQLFMMALAAFSVSAATAQEKNKTETFKVYGNCGMCEDRIEEAAKIAGVATAEWNDESMELSVTYDPSKTTIEKVHKRLQQLVMIQTRKLPRIMCTKSFLAAANMTENQKLTNNLI